MQGARAMGAGDGRVMARHILPNILSAMLVQATVSVPTAIIAGGDPVLPRASASSRRDPSWGTMLNAAQQFLDSAPWMAWWPGLAIFALTLSFNLAGDGLRDWPRPEGLLTPRSLDTSSPPTQYRGGWTMGPSARVAPTSPPPISPGWRSTSMIDVSVNGKRHRVDVDPTRRSCGCCARALGSPARSTAAARRSAARAPCTSTGTRCARACCRCRAAAGKRVTTIEGLARRARTQPLAAPGSRGTCRSAATARPARS